MPPPPPLGSGSCDPGPENAQSMEGIHAPPLSLGLLSFGFWNFSGGFRPCNTRCIANVLHVGDFVIQIGFLCITRGLL